MVSDQGIGNYIEELNKKLDVIILRSTSGLAEALEYRP